MHVPAAVKDTVEPERLHTEGLPDENDTARPELALAATAYTGPPTYVPLGGDVVKLIACGPLATANDWETCGAAEKEPLPAWFASTVQVPGARNETVGPETPHTEGLPEENATERPELAAAVTVYVGPPVAAPPGGVEVKLIVWPAILTAKDCEICGAAW